MNTVVPHRRTGIVLAAHGSHRDPEARATVERHARRLAERGIADEVTVAFHQGEPAFERVLDGLTADRVVIVPFFTSDGHFVRTVLPRALRRNARFADLTVVQTAPVGTHPDIIALVETRIRQLAHEQAFAADRTTVALVGHGTTRHAQSRKATRQLAAALTRRRNGAGQVRALFLDDDPPVEALWTSETHRHVIVIPFLIGGSHAALDLPRRIGLAPLEESHAPVTGWVGDRRVVIDVPIGHHVELADIAGHLALAELEVGDGGIGAVALVGAGPGDPGLITVRGLELLRHADTVVHDRLITRALLNEARAGATIIDAGKAPGSARLTQEQIGALLVAHAQQGRAVVRLKGGDPFVFGRGSEERAACESAGIPCVVVPGITSAIAVPASAGIPITERGVARSFVVLTGRTEAKEGPTPTQIAAAAVLDTIVVLMGRETIGELTTALLAAGRDPATPAAAVSRGTTPAQRVTRATLETLAEAVEHDALEAPIVIVIGAVAAHAHADLAALTSRGEAAVEPAIGHLR